MAERAKYLDKAMEGVEAELVKITSDQRKSALQLCAAAPHRAWSRLALPQHPLPRALSRQGWEGPRSMLSVLAHWKA